MIENDRDLRDDNTRADEEARTHRVQMVMNRGQRSREHSLRWTK